ncbi:d-amino acid oxidase [Scheffersomyces stipitis CBS 6054]|uniref:D-amino acid oxidase n=1 Tax=Scheffersomyces stipitis (strain ATCC 58785 / CBS 6054 / NBRC 10063 / NRRL Y-11545) TaxID=322104 RepID=A3LTK9_PICST|nr:d-amino acid oxidase [Scheffersomyces stipitis CBS 6054]ABN66430.2 d-amino acid oxidase [Scheffersomyces stipitis CBS 6054]KAG2732966.1 hypothetical protein G9P44_003956 [Scheffersomyces stipitis]
MSATTPSKPKVVIVGAGVLGLSTALVLCEKFTHPQLEITVIAEYGPHDLSMNAGLTNYPLYTSPWAGAHFRPFPSKNIQEERESKLTRLTLQKFKELAKSNPESSIEFVQGIEYFEKPDHFYKEIAPGFSNEMDNFSVLPTSSLPEGVEMGVKYDTWVVNSPLYLQFLYRKLRFQYKVNFILTKLTSLRHVNSFVSGSPIIINCSGNGLQYDGGNDLSNFPIRGQTLLINPPSDCKFLHTTITHQSKENLWTFVIPRPLHGGIILGGTKQVDESFTGVRDEDTRALLERGRKLYPELMKENPETGEKYFDIVRINVGLRPARKGGLNLSVESKDVYLDRANHVINNYGAGGMGYELSYGAAIAVYEKLLQLVSSKSAL